MATIIQKKIRKQDEMEQYQSLMATRIAFIFFTFCLLIWSIVNVIMYGALGMAFAILMLGHVIYWGTLVLYKKIMS